MQRDLHVHTLDSGTCTIPVPRRVCRESYNDPPASIGRSMAIENPWTAPVAALGIALPAVILANYIVESVFARRSMARYLRLRALRGAGRGAAPIAEVAA